MNVPRQDSHGTGGATSDPSAGHARVELLAQTTGIRPGQRLWLGVHFSLDKDWHIYWVNPGDSGQPPVLQWRLPSGFNAGEIRWPRPEKLSADYGYKDDALLMVPVQVPSDLKPNAQEEVAVDAKWLVCREVCLPGRARLHLSLPVSSAPVPDAGHALLFAEAQKAWPKPWPPAWKARVVSRKDEFALAVRMGKPIREAQFFPLEPLQIENAAPQKVEANARGAVITLKKSEQLLRPIPVLKGVLALPGGEAYEVQASVAAP